LLGDAAQVVVGVVVFPAQPGVGAYLIYRGVEGGYSTLSGNERWTTQLAKLSCNDQLVFLTETMLPALDLAAGAVAGGKLPTTPRYTIHNGVPPRLPPGRFAGAGDNRVTGILMWQEGGQTRSVVLTSGPANAHAAGLDGRGMLAGATNEN